ncbi:MAG: hypothetical protein AAF619_00960 [Pseudomonadota bacterium]
MSAISYPLEGKQIFNAERRGMVDTDAVRHFPMVDCADALVHLL